MKKVVSYLLKDSMYNLFVACLEERESLSFWFCYNGVILLPTVLGATSPTVLTPLTSEDNFQKTFGVEIYLENLDEEQIEMFLKEYNSYKEEDYSRRFGKEKKRQESYIMTKVIEDGLVYELYFKGGILHARAPETWRAWSWPQRLNTKDPSIIIKMAIVTANKTEPKIERGENNVFRVYNY